MQIYEAPSLSAFPLFHGSVASQARGGFLWLFIGRSFAAWAAFPSAHPALL